MAIRHARVLGVPDQTEPYLVNGVSVDPADVIQPSNWDAAHDMTGVPYFVDLGVVDITDRLTSDATLYTPAAGEVVVALRVTDFVPADSGQLTIGQGAVGGLGQRGLLADLWYGYNGPGNTANDDQIMTGGPVVAYAVGDPWVADQVWPDEAATIIAGGHYWNLDVAGTSAATEPDWASGYGGTIADGTATWADAGLVPTVGSAHVYALVVQLP